jgi:hypothetical protein
LLSQRKEKPKFENPSIISPTSVVAECLFSESKYIFDDRRLGTTPEHVEEIMFLRCNHSLWDLHFFATHVLNSVDEEDPDEGIIQAEVVEDGAEGNAIVLDGNR